MADPTLTVLLDDGTGTFPYNISSRVLSGDGYTITRGRDDWQGAVTTGQLDLTLNNSDGAFTPGGGSSGSGGFGSGGFGSGGFGTGGGTGGITFVDQQIRVQETVNGVTYTRFTGYVKSWPVTWPATVSTFSEVRLTATDAQARAERRPLRSALEEEIIADAPTAYYTLGEAEGSTAAGDTSGNQSSPLTFAGSGSAVAFGGGTGPADGLTAAQFAAGQYLTGTDPDGWTGLTTAPWSLELFAAISVVGATQNLIAVSHTGGATYIELSVQPSGDVTFLGIIGSITGTDIGDGNTHHIALTYDGTTVSLYVDGSLAGSDTDSFSTIPKESIVVGRSVTGTLSHVAVYDYRLSSTQVSTHAAALSGYTESGTARISRLAGYADVPVGTLDTSLTTVSAATGWSGSTAGAEIQKATDAEGGLVFIDGSGNLTFHNRARVSGKTTPDLSLSSQWITPDVAPVLDDQQLVNYMEVTAEGTGSTSLARDTISELAHGRYSGSQSYTVLTDAEALDRANWVISKFAEPTSRYGTLTINLYGMTPAMASTVLAALDLDCWLRVVSMAPQTPGGTTADVVVQSISENHTADEWTIACNVVSRSLYDVFILDDATYGVLDSATPIGY